MGSPIGLQRVVLSSWHQTSLTSTSVLIIGAGAAGLAAGQALAAAGIPSVILEARDRLG
ncbi:MAG: FAD-dependent monooxygenase, partial [Cyanophyceae cyanobacterium]